MVRIELTRQQLYEQVWSEPTMHLAKKYSLSDVGLAKLCKRHNIPKPPPGYWAQKQAGGKPRQTPLPHSTADGSIVLFTRDTPQPVDPVFEAEVKSTCASERKPEALITVAESLRGAHELISAANKEFAGAERDSCGMLLKPENPSLDIAVSRDQLRRALLLLDAILKALRDRGYEVSRGPTVVIFDEEVRFAIKGTVETIREQPAEHDLTGYYEFGHNRFRSKQMPSGRLVLYIPEAELYWADGCRKQWRDATKQKLEHCLNSFVSGLVEFAGKKRDHKIVEERKKAAEAEAERQRQAEAKRRAERRKLQAEERARLEQLLQQIESWRRSDDLRRFIEAVRSGWQDGGKQIAPGGELDQWIRWASMHADRLDPTKESPPSILDEKIPEEPRRW